MGLLRKSLVFRIEKHRSFIERDRERVKEDIEHHNLVEDATARIAERLVKIGEIKEFAKYSLDMDLGEY